MAHIGNRLGGAQSFSEDLIKQFRELHQCWGDLLVASRRVGTQFSREGWEAERLWHAFSHADSAM